MAEFSKRSEAILYECHSDLIKLFEEIIKEYDCTINCGFRGQEDQEKAFKDGYSKAHWLQSPHNYLPALAVDVVPYPTLWADENKLKELGKLVQIKAIDLELKITWGGSWKWKDLPHYELTNWREMI
jgi:peptidoglycan L-alanyl-D-glutamate endopeptidase CwlK